MVDKMHAVCAGNKFVLEQLGRNLDLLDCRLITRELIERHALRFVGTASRDEVESIVQTHSPYWSLTYRLDDMQGSDIDGPLEVRIDLVSGDAYFAE